MFGVSFITAKNTDKEWSGVYGYRPDSEDELDLKGEILIVLSLSTTIDFEMEQLAKLLFDEIQQSYYFADRYTKPLDQIESAIDMMSKRIDKIMEREPRLVEAGLDLQCAVNLVRGNVAYVATIGEAKVTLVRASKVIHIDPSLQDTTGKGFLRTGSFKLEPAADTLFLMTEKAEAMISRNTLTKIADDLDLSSLKIIDEELFTIAVVTDEQRVEAAKQRQLQAELERAELEKAERLAAAKSIKPQVVEPELEILDELTEVSEEAELPIAIEEETLIDIPETEDIGEEEIVIQPRSANRFAKPSAAAAQQTFAKLKAKVQPALANVSARISKLELRKKMGALRDKATAFAKVDNNGEAKTYQVILSKIVLRMRNLWTVIMRFFRKNVLGKEVGRGGAMYLKGRKPTRNWRLIAVVVVVMLVVIYSLVSTAVDNSNQQSMKIAATSKLKEYRDKLDKIEANVTESLIGTSNEPKRISQINEINKDIKSVQDVDISKVRESTDLANSKKEIVALMQAQIDRVRGIKLIQDPVLIADLGINLQNVKASDIEFYKGNVYVSDHNNNTIYKIAAQSGATPVKFTSGSLQLPNAIAVDANGNLIVFDEDPQNSISTVNLNDGSVQKHVGGLNTGATGIPSNITSTRIGNEDRLYWIDTRNNELKWARRSPVGGYGTTASIRRTDPDYSTANDIEVNDGRIYVLSPEKGLLRYFSDGTRANNLIPDNYTLTGILPDDSLTQMSAFEIEGNNVFLADSRRQRIVMLSKARNGNAGFVDFVQQLVYRGSDDKFKNIIDLIYVDSEKVLYVLDGQKIYRVKLP
jgi:hypothetical protein